MARKRKRAHSKRKHKSRSRGSSPQPQDKTQEQATVDEDVRAVESPSTPTPQDKTPEQPTVGEDVHGAESPATPTPQDKTQVQPTVAKDVRRAESPTTATPQDKTQEKTKMTEDVRAAGSTISASSLAVHRRRKASKLSRVSWGAEAARPAPEVVSPDHTAHESSSSRAGVGWAPDEELETDVPRDSDKVVERRLVTMFKRQLRTFLFPPKKRRGFVFPYEDEDILDGLPCREDKPTPWMIHPKETFRNAWDVCMVVMSFANVILVPLNMAFFERVQEEQPEWRIFNLVSDVVFFIDVLLNFRTGVPMKEDHCRINMDPDYVAEKYRSGSFYVDTFSCVPLDYIALVVMHTGDKPFDPSVTSAYPSLLRVNKLLALPKIGRLTTVISNLADVEENFFVYSTGVYVRLLFNLGMLFLLIHWHGCLQFYVDRLEGFPSTSWVARMDLLNSSWAIQYSWSVYASTSMMMGVGMGAVEADNTTDSWLRCGCMATGHILQALLVGACIDMITSMNFTRLRNRQKIRDLDDYMNYMMLPLKLQHRIRDYAENRYKGRVFDEAQIIDALSDPLRQRVMWHNCRRVLRNVPFFARAEPDFLRDLVVYMKAEFFTPGDVVAAAGTMGDRLYLLQSGSARVVDELGTTVATVMPGDRFGEVPAA